MPSIAFAGSEGFLRVVLAARRSGRAASQVLGIEDAYEAFCVDEAAGFVNAQLEAGMRPVRHVSNREIAQSLEKGRWE